jgi:uncharacterized protein YdeI (YjbR/CyaY-like superfamily)
MATATLNKLDSLGRLDRVDTFNPTVDAYINQAKPFAQPILEHLRELVHKGCPGVEETIKWSRPFFEYTGVILGNMSAFKEHCSFGFWGEEIGVVLREAGILRDEGMGSLGRITAVKDLPPDKQMLAWIRQAAAFVDTGQYTSPVAARNKVVKAPKSAPETPEEFAAALKKSKKAAEAFAAFSPSRKREYLEWIAEAKRPETRDKRIGTAIEWIAEGKQRNWKYQNC